MVIIVQVKKWGEYSFRSVRIEIHGDEELAQEILELLRQQKEYNIE